MKNKKQREFIRSIERTAEKSNAAYGRLYLAMQISPGNKIANEQYLESLNSFINSCNKMVLETQLAFGEGVDAINLQRAANNALKPHTLN